MSAEIIYESLVWNKDLVIERVKSECGYCRRVKKPTGLCVRHVGWYDYVYNPDDWGMNTTIHVDSWAHAREFLRGNASAPSFFSRTPPSVPVEDEIVRTEQFIGQVV